MSTKELQEILSHMVGEAINGLNGELARADNSISKLTTISRYEGYGIALHELGADTEKLGAIVEIEAKKIEPIIRSLFK